MVTTGSRGRARDRAVQSVDRAVSVLQILAVRGPCGVTEIAGQLGVHKTTVFRLLATLEARGLVEQGAGRGRYRIGHPLTELAAAAAKNTDLFLLSRPVCQELAQSAGDTVNVSVREGRDVVTVGQVAGEASIASVDWVGRRCPLHASAAGKVFLAHPAPDRHGRLPAELPVGGRLERYTPRTITRREHLAKELAAVRERGYAVSFEEYEIGLVSLAAPVRALDDTVVAAVTLAGPAFRIREDTAPALAGLLLAAAARISWRRGQVKRG
ncbi:IclR family transcriptional regulator [Streptomyces sp. NPDC002795]|uniref:IclR family transcriptional regulator n=1 Tax=Streptomyces sp. NPDC002795 TaxID=3364665 RepID=UPI0036C30CC9